MNTFLLVRAPENRSAAIRRRIPHDNAISRDLSARKRIKSPLICNMRDYCLLRKMGHGRDLDAQSDHE